MAEPTVWTIGHSTRTLDEVVALLRDHLVRGVVDVRTVPRSRHTPHFNEDTLGPALAERGIPYRHLAALGGLRHSRKDSVNTGWRNASFRGYADYMQTPEFAAGIEELLEIARERPTAIMCAEAVPWRCHRSMIGDALIVRGIRVLDIIGSGAAREETLTSFAHIEGLTITYPATQEKTDA
ncbi:DUF488 domain-containing protein [Microbacterium protaetiae]|uniref:DUF488 domain-containing protein n=1 Tax=Microbacterium protaetiae TaxID=2509458 RepID=A0A4P6E946_9MICO|nr:DUF488 domain-containing protein [Microbacterium protaetiae]QAY58555.1 DUF488 domain-containing protein [Microbacterium protaetiae]